MQSQPNRSNKNLICQSGRESTPVHKVEGEGEDPKGAQKKEKKKRDGVLNSCKHS